MDIFEYTFMQRAFIIGILVAMTIPSIGLVIVLRRLSMIGDALSHTSLAGVAIGLIAGIHPVLTATAICIFASLVIEFIRKRFDSYSEVAIAVVMSTGMGLAAILSSYVGNAANFNTYLFGSIVAISREEVYSISILCGIVLILSFLFRKEMFLLAMGTVPARLANVPVKSMNLLFTIMTATVISVASRTVGALMISSLLIIPVVCSMQIGKSYRAILWLTRIFAVVFTIVGLSASYYLGMKPGGSTVITGVIVFLFLLYITTRKRKIA